MGQSAKRNAQAADPATGSPNLSIFPTAYGWFGVLGENGNVLAVFVGHSSADQVRSACAKATRREPCNRALLSEADWHPELRRRLERYCSGEPVTFDDISLALPAATPFQRRVLDLTRRVGYGRTMTYGAMAERAGHPGAARAVGSVMASNRFPIVIPCHRVVAGGGKPGGYTSPQGIDLKLRFLAMEREVSAATSRPRSAAQRSTSRRGRQALVR